MIGIALGVVAVLATATGIGGYLTLAYWEGEEDYRRHQYSNLKRGAVAKAYDRGWDAAGRAKIRLEQNAEAKRNER